MRGKFRRRGARGVAAMAALGVTAVGGASEAPALEKLSPDFYEASQNTPAQNNDGEISKNNVSWDHFIKTSPRLPSPSLKTFVNTPLNIDLFKDSHGGIGYFQESTMKIEGANGKWSNVGDGKVVFTPPKDFYGLAKASYSVETSGGSIVVATIDVFVSEDGERLV